MAISYQMTWVPSRAGWMKTKLGKTYSISCRQLGVPPTKEASWRAANAWWAIKERSLAATAREALEAEEGAWVATRVRSKTIRQDGEMDGVNTVHIEEVPEQPDDWVGLRVLDQFTSFERSDFVEEGPAKLVTPDRTLGALVDQWILQQQLAAKPRDAGRKGRITAARADNIRIAMVHFVGFLGRDLDIDVAVTRLRSFHGFCETKGWSPDYCKTVFGIAKSFIRWLDQEELIARLPRNLNSRDFRFKVLPKKVPTFTLEEIHTLLGAATGQLKLHLLMFLNCGMTQTDISDLRHDEVDWVHGRVIRRRSKHSDKLSEDIPTVDYLLWPATFKLLKKHRSADPDRVLVTKSGGPWVRNELDEKGHLRCSDSFRRNYSHLQAKTKITKPPKLMRKTSTSLIESHEHYGRYTSHFLGNSPKGVTDKHYSMPSKELFDTIVTWLGEKYGY